jgi:hypothetical protein
MMAMGIAYRLLPMMLPAAMPKGAGPVLSALLLEAGTLWLAASFLFGLPGRSLAAIVTASGVTIFFTQVVWMLRHRKPVPANRPARDWGRLHAAQALMYLLMAVVLGVVFATGRLDETTVLRWAPIYGLCGLLGFLARLIVGVGSYIFPYAVWLRTAHAAGYQPIPPAPHLLPHRGLEATVFTLWTLALPLMAIGLYRQWSMVIALSGALLLVAVGVAVWNVRFMNARARAVGP